MSQDAESISENQIKYKLKLYNETKRLISSCVNCRLHKSRSQVVFGFGNLNSDIMFIGRDPGSEEDFYGIPFVGRAGKRLNIALRKVGINRPDKPDHIVHQNKRNKSKIYITNIVHCLRGATRIILEDGSTDTIRNIVKSKYSGKVLSFNIRTKKIEAKPVINWYTSQKGDRKFVKITHKYSRRKCDNKTFGPIVTEDHLILTKNGYKEAKKINKNDFLVTTNIIPCMNYKLPKHLKKNTINAENRILKKFSTTTFYAPVPMVEIKKIKEQSVFCIDVKDNHNFLSASGIVLHNCHTPENRGPTKDEIEECRQWILKEIKIIQPKVIVTVGREVTEEILGKIGSITNISGKKYFDVNLNVTIVPLMHPAYVIRNMDNIKLQTKFDLHVKEAVKWTKIQKLL